MDKRAKHLSQLVDQSRRLLGAPDLKGFREVERRIKLLEERETSVSEASLVVALLGGTKVGKTTLVNALAGKVIGQASAIACFTSRPAVYVHKNREAVARARLAGVLQEGDKIEIHQESSLEGIILVDTPDFDGIEFSHRSIFQKILERADLALCVVTTQKYDAAELFGILGMEMGFRRTVIVFNRIDEGIPFSSRIKDDLLRKISQFHLKPPEGESLPLFSVSALNGLRNKTGIESGYSGEFAELEKFLCEHLDKAIIKQINEENLRTFDAETTTFVRESCRLEAAIKAAPEILKKAEDEIRLLGEKIQETTDSSMKPVFGELAHRRAAAVGEHMNGPFGAYLRFSLAVQGLARGIPFSFTSFTGDPAEGMAERLMKIQEPFIQEAQQRIRNEVSELTDRAGFNAGFLIARIDDSWSHFQGAKSAALEIRTKLSEPRVSGFEKILMNILPISIILLLIRYFMFALLAAKDPAAGMFIGGGLMFWLVCHVQASIWIWGKAGSSDSAVAEINSIFLSEARERLVAPIQNWTSELKKLTESPKD